MVEALDLASSEFSIQRGSRLGSATQVAIVFTDGFSNKDPAPAASRLRQKGVTVYALAIDKPRNLDELEAIAGHSSRVYTDETLESFMAELYRLTSHC